MILTLVMLVLWLLLVATALCSNIVHGVSSIVPLNANLPDRIWNGLASDASGQYLVATSSLPYQLYTSNDHGVSWEFRHNITMYGIASNSSGQMIAGIGAYCMYYSYDYGATFQNVSIPLVSPQWLYYISMSSSGQYVYVAVLGDQRASILRSNDSGQSYYNISTIPGGNFVYALKTNAEGNFVIAMCYGFGVYTSFDYGVTFNLANKMYNVYSTLSLDSTGQYMIGAYMASAYHSSNYGVNWTQLSVPTNSDFKSSCSSSDGDILYLATNPYVYASYSAGQFWNKTSFPTNNYLLVVCNAAGSQASAAVYDGSILTMAEIAPPTSRPTSQPSSMPSCSHGAGMNDDHSTHGGCSECAPGTYATALGGVCEVCPVGYYTSEYGETSCSKCPYPTKSVFDQSTACDGFSLGASIRITLVVLGALVLVVVLCVLSSVKRTAVMVNLIFPTLDLFSDIAYLITNDFYSPILFALGVLFVIVPIPSFLLTLYRNKAVMPRLTWRCERLWWLSAGSMEQDHIYYAKFPCFGGDERFPLLSCAKHDNLCSLTLEGVVWVIAIVSQIVTIVGYPFLILANIVFLFVWLFVGMFLYVSKTMAVGNVWNLWFTLWTGVSDHNTEVDVDTEELNGSLQHEFYFETLPQVILQLVNNLLLKDFTPLAIFSLVQSLVMALNGIWRFGYYRYVVRTPVPLKDIPIDMTIRLKLEKFGIDMVLLDGRLEPNSKKEPNEASQRREDLKKSLFVHADDEGAKVGADRSSDVDGRRSSYTKKQEDASSGVDAVAVDTISAVL